MNKKTIFVIILIAIIGGFYLSRRSVSKPVETTKTQANFPKDWQISDNKSVQTEVIKKVDSGYKPQVVLVKSNSKEALNPAKYVDSLIAGAKSTIPSLKISTDKRFSEETKYTALLTGTYYNKTTKINLVQRVIIKGEDVYTYTGSFTGDLESEINSVIDLVPIN